MDSTGLKMARIILWLMMPALLIDAMNGWLIRVAPNAISISQFYRIALTGLIFVWLARHWRMGMLLLWSVLATLLACMFYHSFFYYQNSWAILDLHFQLRLILHFIFFLFLRFYAGTITSQRIHGMRFGIYVRRLFWFSYVVIAANIILGTLGIGYSTVPTFGGDDQGYGGLGFFKAGNDVGSTFVIIAAVLMYWRWMESRKISGYVFLGILSLLLAVLLQTKTVIAGIFIIWAVIPWVSAGSLLSDFRIQKKSLMMVLLMFFALLSLLAWFLSADMGVVKKFLYFYQEQGLLFAVLSGRDYFARLATELAISSYSWGDFILGRGWSNYLAGMATLYGGSEKLVEIDYFDIFMIDGLLGLVLQLLIWAFYLVQAHNARHSAIGQFVLFMDLLLLGIAGTAGHVLYSTLNSMFIALLNILPLIERAVIQKGISGEVGGGGNVASSAQRQ